MTKQSFELENQGVKIGRKDSAQKGQPTSDLQWRDSAFYPVRTGILSPEITEKADAIPRFLLLPDVSFLAVTQLVPRSLKADISRPFFVFDKR